FELHQQFSVRRLDIIDLHAQHFDPRFVASQRGFDRRANQLQRRAVEACKHQLVDAAAEIRTHDPLTGSGFENDPNRLADVLLVFDSRDLAGARIEHYWHRPSAAKEILLLEIGVADAHVIIRSSRSVRRKRWRWEGRFPRSDLPAAPRAGRRSSLWCCPARRS